LVLVEGGKRSCPVKVFRSSIHLEGGARESVSKASLNERNGKVGDVDADPPALELLGSVNGCPTAAERVEDCSTLFA
jgi:hypothetical protein